MSCINLLWIAKLDYAEGWGIRIHSHDFRQLYYVTSGEGKMQIGGKDFPLKENDCILIKPNEAHRLYRVKNSKLRIIDVKFIVNSPELFEELGQMPSCFSITGADTILTLLSQMREEWKHTRLYRAELSGVLLEQILYLFLRMCLDQPHQSQEPTLLVPKDFTGIPGQIVEYLETHYNCEFSLDDLADKLCYNKNYLCKIFKNATKYTIKNYVNLLRIQRATELICRSTKKLSEISDDVGFKNIHHFNRVYKQIMGHTPGDVRTQEKEGMYSDMVGHGEFTYRYYSPNED